MNKLLESLLSSEFTFGFEFEAYVSDETLEKYNLENEKSDNMSNEEIWGLEDTNDVKDKDSQWWDEQDNEPEYDIDELYTNLEYEFSKFFGSNAKVISDGSLGTGGFEFPTPPMSLTPSNIKHCIDFLNTCLNKWDIYTDESCGFHVHFSFPQMTVKDMSWIICQIAMNDNYWHELTQFSTEYDSIEFLSSWAKTDFLEEIRKCIDTEGLPDFKKLSSLLSSDKYRLLRLHPQGTIEWRGPRNFLNNKNINLIYEFFYKVLKVSRMFAKCMDEKTLGKYLNRASFDRIIDFSNIDKEPSLIKNDDSDIYTKIAKQAVKNPNTLLKLKDYRNINYETLVSVIQAVCSQYNDKSLESLLIELRYKPFKSYHLLSNIIKIFPDFINYINQGVSKVIKTINDEYSNIYNIIGKAKSIKPEIMHEIIMYMKEALPMYNLHSFVTGIKNNPHSKILTNKSTIQEFVKLYGKNKVENAFRRKGFNLSDYLK